MVSDLSSPRVTNTLTSSDNRLLSSFFTFRINGIIQYILLRLVLLLFIVLVSSSTMLHLSIIYCFLSLCHISSTYMPHVLILLEMHTAVVCTSQIRGGKFSSPWLEGGVLSYKGMSCWRLSSMGKQVSFSLPPWADPRIFI